MFEDDLEEIINDFESSFPGSENLSMYCSAVRNHRDPENLANAFISLKRLNLLSQRNCDLVIASVDPCAVANAIVQDDFESISSSSVEADLAVYDEEREHEAAEEVDIMDYLFSTPCPRGC